VCDILRPVLQWSYTVFFVCASTARPLSVLPLLPFSLCNFYFFYFDLVPCFLITHTLLLFDARCATCDTSAGYRSAPTGLASLGARVFVHHHIVIAHSWSLFFCVRSLDPPFWMAHSTCQKHYFYLAFSSLFSPECSVHFPRGVLLLLQSTLHSVLRV